MTQATYRGATDADSSAVAVLVERYWAFEHIEGFESQRVVSLLTEILATPEHGAMWVAEKEGQLIGYLLAVYLWSLEYGGMMAQIDEFFILPEIRSGGVGTGLLRYAEAEMTSSGLVHLELQLAVTNIRGRIFYRHHGFQERAGYELLDKPLR